jgi:5-methylcytosine-specific restriction endonuclease McrA
MENKAIMLEEWDIPVKCANGKEYPRPSVIILKKYESPKYKKKVYFSKLQMLVRDEFKCCYCGTQLGYGTDNIPEIEHIVPKKLNGKNDFENCVTSCRKCNEKKGARPVESTLLKLNKKPHTPEKSHPIRFVSTMRIDDIPHWISYIPDAKKYALYMKIPHKTKEVIKECLKI